MRIQFHHQFFAGPDAPGPAQPRKLVRFLADRGHAVDVVAGDFNVYNEQDEPEESYVTSAGGSVHVHRLRTPRGVRASLGTRLKTYLRFAWISHGFGRTLPVPDVVMASIQPLFSGYTALRLARHWKRPFLLEIRDLWPDALVVKGAISNWQAWPLKSVARTLYASADRLVSLTPGIKTELLKKGVRADRVDLFPNGFDPELFNLPADTRARIREQFGWGDQFVAAYTGTHTEVTAINVIVRAAAVLRHRPDIRIDLFGSGQTKAGAVALAKSLGLDNIHFHDPVPKSKVASILAGVDLGLMTLFRSPLIHIYFENKLIDYMGAGKPIAAAMEGVQAEIIHRVGAGTVVPGFDHEGLARLIEEAANQPALCRERGLAGRRFVQSHLSQPAILERYADVLEALARGDSHQVPVWDPLQ
jgi:glycosyltransferase involved in cell wall biosynthesis